jgi:hypothetical protein
MADGLLALLTQRTADADPRMAEIIAKVRQQMPDVADASIEPMGMVGSFLAPGGAMAVTSPFGGVTYRPEAMKSLSDPDAADAIAHELTHVRQVRNHSFGQKTLGGVFEGLKNTFGFGLPYGQRPDELEAFQTESNRQLAEHRSPNPRPGFNTDEWQTLGDIHLQAPRKK